MMTLAICITGRLGHRGGDINALIETAKSLRAVNPRIWLGFSTSDELTRDETQKLSKVFDATVAEALPANPKLSPALTSLMRQTSQFSILEKMVPAEFLYVVRLRTDWRVDSPKRFFEQLEKSVFGGSRLSIVNVNIPRFSVLPIPWHGNDYVTWGIRDEIARFWKPFSSKEIEWLSVKRAFFSRAMYFYPGSPVLTVEQLLFRRYLTGDAYSENKRFWSWVEIQKFNEFSGAINVFQLQDIGARPPSAILPTNQMFSLFFRSKLRFYNEFCNLTAGQLVGAWFIANWLFFVHPIWLGSRFKWLHLKLRSKIGA